MKKAGQVCNAATVSNMANHEQEVLREKRKLSEAYSVFDTVKTKPFPVS
tara:strand:+ start:871 stop:1017 length:147 start_codon:yes stop_codon:yes gene_type:complete